MSAMPRRRFLASAATALVGGSLVKRALGAPQLPMAELSAGAPLIVSTWPFGKPANEKALAVLASGGSGLDAIEQGNATAADDIIKIDFEVTLV